MSEHPAESLIVKTPASPDLLRKLAGLRVELMDLAFALDCQGSREAADVAMTTSARVEELCEEFGSSKP
jgi:hypothetical protein